LRLILTQDRPQKITFAEMRSSGVRMTFGCLISNQDLFVRPAASAVPTCGPTSIGISRGR
jgi:hypothetical protein